MAKKDPLPWMIRVLVILAIVAIVLIVGPIFLSEGR